MEKIKSLLIVILIIPFALLGCKQQNSKLNLEAEIKEVKIFESSEFQTERSELIVSATEKDYPEIFETVKKIIQAGTKQDGIVDTVAPNYYLELIYLDNSTKELYLWLLDAEGAKGSFMEVEDTHTIYNFSEELNTQLTELIYSVKN